MGLSINATMPTSNVYNSVPSIYNYENTLNNVREHGAFVNFSGSVTLAHNASADLYDQNQAPDRHIIVAMSIDQGAWGAYRVLYRIRAAGPLYGFFATALFTPTPIALTITNVTISGTNYIRLNNVSGSTKTFQWAVSGF